jgi:predicted dienelactone hydrolase
LSNIGSGSGLKLKRVFQLAKSLYKLLPKNLRPVPGDRMRGRRVKKRLTTIAVIAALSVVAAFVITRQSGGSGFSPPAVLLPTTAATPARSSTVSEPPPVTDLSPAIDSKVSISDEPVDGYKLETGPLAVTEVSGIVLHDAKRNKDLHVRVFYPVAAGKYPVIVFSHGAGGSLTCCDSLTRHWATYGYITLQPTHDDSVIARRNSGDKGLRFPQAVREALKTPALWESRPQDISFLLDSLPELQKRIAGLSDKIDANRIGVAGHSMGSYTAEAVGGALVDLPGRLGTSFGDSRTRAVLCLSPQGPGQFGLSAHSFEKMALPFMGITGSLDNLGPLANAAWHKTPFDHSPVGNKFEVFIQGANHMSFITDETLVATHSSQAAAILGYTNSASLAFWDAYLKDDSAAKQFLQSDLLERYSHGAAKLSRR